MRDSIKGKTADERNERFDFCKEKYEKLLLEEVKMYNVSVENKVN